MCDPLYRLAIAGGLLGALAFNPIPWDYFDPAHQRPWLATLAQATEWLRILIPLAPLLLFLALRGATTAGAGARRMFVGSWVLYFGALNWLCSLIAYNPLAPVGVMIMAGYMAAFPALGAWVARRWCWPKSIHAQFWSFGALWIFGEYLRTLGRLGAPLAELGHAWAPVPELIRIAAGLGELGVTLTVLLLAWLLMLALMATDKMHRFEGERPTKRVWIYAGVAVAVWGGFTYAALPLFSAGKRAPRSLTVTLLQPNIDQPTKFESYANPDPRVQAGLQEKMTRIQEDMLTTTSASPLPQLIIFPESSFTQPEFNLDGVLHERIARLARRTQAALLVGGNRFVPKGGEDYEIYNSMYLVRGNGDWDARVYDKLRLVPFGEDIPYLDLIPGVRDLVGVGSFNIGREQTVFTLDSATTGGLPLRFGGLICFESTFASMARGLARKGVDFIAVVTNDGWYGLSAGAAQHHHLSQLRAVETGCWILRCANTGISSFIDPQGRVVDSLGLMRKGLLERQINFTTLPGRTLFTRCGHGWLWLPALWLACSIRRTRRERKEQR
jgi:apolipoprotein N-acyltransferase